VRQLEARVGACLCRKSINFLVLRGLIATSEGKVPKQESMNVEDLFLFHFIMNFRESAYRMHYFVYTAFGDSVTKLISSVAMLKFRFQLSPSAVLTLFSYF